MTRSRRRLAFAVLAPLLLVGCGSGGGDDAGTEHDASPGGDATTDALASPTDGTVTGDTSVANDAGSIDATTEDASEAGLDAAGGGDGGDAATGGDANAPLDAGIGFIPLIGSGLNFSFGAIFEFGTPAQPLPLMIDTGSADLAVASAHTCCTSLDGGPPDDVPEGLYNHAASSTYAPDAAGAGTPVDVSYGVGGFTGYQSFDRVGLSGSEELPAPLMGFVEITAAEDMFPPNGPDGGTSIYAGIAGFGPTVAEVGALDDFPLNDIDAGVPALFAFQFCDTTGKLWFGTTDPSAMTAPPHYSALNPTGGATNNYWYTVATQGLAVGAAAVTASASGLENMLVDTGTSLVVLPSVYYDQVVSLLDADHGFTSMFGSVAAFLDSTTGCLAPLTPADEATVNATLPQLAMTLPDVAGGTFTLSNPATSAYLVYDPIDLPSTPYCFTLQENDDFPPIMGDVFTSQYIIIFDLANGRVGFAPQTGCPATPQVRRPGRGRPPRPHLPRTRTLRAHRR